MPRAPATLHATASRDLSRAQSTNPRDAPTIRMRRAVAQTPKSKSRISCAAAQRPSFIKSSRSPPCAPASFLTSSAKNHSRDGMRAIAKKIFARLTKSTGISRSPKAFMYRASSANCAPRQRTLRAFRRDRRSYNAVEAAFRFPALRSIDDVRTDGRVGRGIGLLRCGASLLCEREPALPRRFTGRDESDGDVSSREKSRHERASDSRLWLGPLRRSIVRVRQRRQSKSRAERGRRA